MIRNVIFDIGNVLVSFHPVEYFYPVFKEKTETLCTYVFGSKEWALYDQGILTKEEIMKLMLIIEECLFFLWLMELLICLMDMVVDLFMTMVIVGMKINLMINIKFGIIKSIHA